MLGSEARREVSRAISQVLAALCTGLEAPALVASPPSSPSFGEEEEEAFEARHQSVRPLKVVAEGSIELIVTYVVEGVKGSALFEVSR